MHNKSKTCISPAWIKYAARQWCRIAEKNGGNVGKFFDRWAENGRHRRMEGGHVKSVGLFLDTVKFRDGFSFLDIGCGNGWTVRRVAKNPKCARAVGIDASKKMVSLAGSLSVSEKEQYVHTKVESYSHCPYDYAFAMESIYYAESVQDAVKSVWRILRRGGRFFCGTDYYAENVQTRKWQQQMDVRMHLLSRRQWREVFEDAGFRVRTRLIRDPNGSEAWRRTAGTLFVCGTKR